MKIEMKQKSDEEIIRDAEKSNDMYRLDRVSLFEKYLPEARKSQTEIVLAEVEEILEGMKWIKPSSELAKHQNFVVEAIEEKIETTLKAPEQEGEKK